ncbi:hypothetical protein [Fuerstiella marisgermanici]|uniref:HEAT repeat domain-containing protein n=1 Tax=Fuerstiella marisgermanici TaxID=1891926 RepID=A0A1P8WIU6_9PLAN|nr:hypothetical protein [Fuerstiella marisgermanici]APZ93964.1 hypothetical protein Fuma_03582 [Fuerstiella marisgermanici]
MPITDQVERWPATLLRVVLLIATVGGPLTNARAFDEGAAAGQSAPPAAAAGEGDATGKEAAKPAAPKPLPGIAPEVAPTTKDDYLRDQRRRVQELRRLQMTMTPQVLTDYQKVQRDFRSLLFQGDMPKQKDLETIKTGLKFMVLSLSDKDVQAVPLDFENAVKKLRNELGRAGAGKINPAAKAKFRELVMGETFTLLQGLMKHNLLARSAAIEVLQDLEVVPSTGGARLTMYDKVDDELVRIMMDKDQPDAVKVRVANTMVNYLEKADAIPQIQAAFARAVATELDKPFLDESYQVFLLATLEKVTIAREVVAPQQAIAICAAAKFLRNPSFELLPRCRAARVLGRAGYDAQMNFDVLAWATADLATETAFKFNQAQDKKDQKWVLCASYLYTAFHHWDRDEATGRPADALPKGFLNRADKSEVVREAYNSAIPLIHHMLFQTKGISRNDLGKLFQWVTANKPANLKFDPSCPPLAMPAANPPAQGGGGN